MVTTGSQQALDLTARVFIDPGSVVLVELPTYTGGITAFNNAQATLVGRSSGQPTASISRISTASPRASAPPAGGSRFSTSSRIFRIRRACSLSLEKRRQLLEWAARRNVLIVEDDPYGALYFDDVASAADTRPIKADDRDGRVVYLSSFSKTVAPGFRVAWIAAPLPIAAKLEVAKQAADLCTGGLDQRIVYEVWKRGVLTSRLPALRSCYQEKRTVMVNALRRELGDLVSWPEPKGGFFLWAAFPERVNTDVLLTRAVARAVVLRRRQRVLCRRTQQQLRAARVFRGVAGADRGRRSPPRGRRSRGSRRRYIFGTVGASVAGPVGVTGDRVRQRAPAQPLPARSTRAIAATVAPFSMSFVTTNTTGPRDARHGRDVRRRGDVVAAAESPAGRTFRASRRRAASSTRS